jgi:urea transport system permease protein
VRTQAIKTLQGEVDESKLPMLDKAFAQEAVPELKDRLGLLRAAALLSSTDKGKRLEAAKLLGRQFAGSHQNLVD